MYNFAQINHITILTHSVLVGVTPLIPVPILDDWVKNAFMRNMVRQLTSARQIPLTPNQIDALIQEDFWDSCAEGCINIVFYIIREFLSKIFFFLEFRRAFNLVGTTYYTGFLLDAALMDGYKLADENGSTHSAEWLRESIRRARYGANLKLIQRVFRENFRPLAALQATWMIIRRAVGSLPKLIVAFPGAVWRSIRVAPRQVASGVVSLGSIIKSIPNRIRENFHLRVQVLLGREKAPEIRVIERFVQAMYSTLLRTDHGHFDQLHEKLISELNRKLPA